MIVDSLLCPNSRRDVLTSAFDSAGQRCSALRVLFLQETWPTACWIKFSAHGRAQAWRSFNLATMSARDRPGARANLGAHAER